MEGWETRLDRQGMSKEEKALFVRFAEKCQAKADSAGPARLEKFRSVLVIAQSMTGMDLSETLKDMKGLERAAAAINADKRYAPNTKADVKRLLGRLYHFKRTGEPELKYADRTLKEAVRHEIKPADKRLARAVITREEMRELLRFGNTLDKAIISLLYDSGMRIGEFSQLRKEDLTHTAEGMDVRVPGGKTGERQVVVVEASKHVGRWLEEHPDKGKAGPLWVSPDTRKPLRFPAIAKRIREAAGRMNEQRKKNGLPAFSKSVNPHNFRHSRASELGGMPGMTEAIMCRLFGWELGSDMPRTYLHLTFAQVKKAVLATHGKAKPEEKVLITHRACRKCQEENPLSVVYCGKCGQPMDSDKEITRMGELEERLKGMKKEMESMRATLRAELLKDIAAGRKKG